MNALISRRTFLKTALALSASTAVPSAFTSLAAPIRRYSAPYLRWMDSAYLAPLNELFYNAIGDHTFSFILYDLTNERLIASVQAENALPVASAFKAPLLMYFIYMIEAGVWGSVPVEYWGSTRADQVPAEYHSAWYQHNNILRDLYKMITISDNDATGRVLLYVSRYYNTDKPLVRFNDWAHGIVGISQLSGLSDWYYGIPASEDPTDHRYGGITSIDHEAYRYANLYTARDMGLFYTWFLDEFSAQQQLVCGTLLTQIYADRRANIERLAANNGGMAFSKNGNLGRDISPAGITITDAGLVTHGNGTTYLVAMLCVNAEDQIAEVFKIADDVLKGYYDDFIQENLPAPPSSADDAFANYLSRTYNSPLQLRPHQYNYGFIKRAALQVYSAPDEAAHLHNPVLSSSRFGVHLLMQGALLRFMPVDHTWAQLIPDNEADSLPQKLARQVYVKLNDLVPIHLDYAAPIPFLLDSRCRPEHKLLVVDIGRLQLGLLEGGNVVFQTPIALNDRSTPRGSYPIINRWLCRHMQAWAPGVPFASFFHSEGYAIHGAPWQRWQETVTQSNLWTRTSAGCINIPNWTIDIGYYRRPVDELIFRWLGGMTTPESAVLEYPSAGYNQVRVFVVDRLSDLQAHQLPDSIAQRGVTWSQVIANLQYVAPLALPTFFS
jgi:hypothetical protein